MVAKRFFDFCVADTARYQLMFQRVIPDFEPSPASYALAVDHLEKARARMRAAGFDADRSLDLWTAMTTGLVDQQISNDPGGDRWSRLIDDCVAMFLAYCQPAKPSTKRIKPNRTHTTPTTKGARP